MGMRIHPWKVFFALLCNVKGPDARVTKRIAQLIKDLGLTHFGYKSDREASIRAVLREAAKIANVSVEDLSTALAADDTAAGPIVAVPETSSPGESASNGDAERTIQLIEDQARILKLALEDHIGAQIPCDHPIMGWIVDHAAMLLTKCHPSAPDGKTAYERLHGEPARDRLAEFGEVVFYFVPKRLRAKMDPRWRVGVFL